MFKSQSLESIEELESANSVAYSSAVLMVLFLL